MISVITVFALQILGFVTYLTFKTMTSYSGSKFKYFNLRLFMLAGLLMACTSSILTFVPEAAEGLKTILQFDITTSKVGMVIMGTNVGSIVRNAMKSASANKANETV